MRLRAPSVDHLWVTALLLGALEAFGYHKHSSYKLQFVLSVSVCSRLGAGSGPGYHITYYTLHITDEQPEILINYT